MTTPSCPMFYPGSGGSAPSLYRSPVSGASDPHLFSPSPEERLCSRDAVPLAWNWQDIQSFRSSVQAMPTLQQSNSVSVLLWLAQSLFPAGESLFQAELQPVLPRPALGPVLEQLLPNTCKQTGPGPLLSHDYIILGLGRSELSFKLTSLFDGSSDLC